MRKALIVSVCTVAVAASIAFAIPGAAAMSPGSGNPSRTSLPAISGPAVSGRLSGVAAISDRDVWAVGLTPNSSLAVHWNGARWTDYTSPLGYYTAVAATAARDVWAVGGTNWFSPTDTLAEHWNGSAWKRIPTPNPAGGGYFQAVTATSATNAWAVGLAGPGPGIPSPTTPLIEHWDGRHWTIQKSQVPSTGGEFAGVAATSATNAWAVGWTGPASEGTGQALIEHWNGRAWTRVATPSLGVSYLKAVTAVSSANVWAVGNVTVGGNYRTLVLHWDGRHWTLVPSPSPGGDATFLGVAASWTHNIWAVGYTNPTRCGHGPACQTLIEHWNSVRWKVIPSPNPPSAYLNLLSGVSAIARGDIWAVGTTDFGNTLMVHWNGTSWS